MDISRSINLGKIEKCYPMKKCYLRQSLMLLLLGFVTLGWVQNANAQVSFQIGSGTTPTSSSNSESTPFGTYYHDDRTQMLYLASELLANGGTNGLVQSVGFEVASADPAGMNGFTIKMGHTSSTELTGWETNTTTVYSSGSYTASNGWNDFVLQTPFLWNGVDNVVIEVCFDNAAWTNSSTIFYGSTSFNSVWSRYCDFCSICGDNTLGSGFQDRVNTRFTVLPPAPDEAGVLSVDSPYVPSCVIDSNVYATIVNTGSDILTAVTVEWSVNGTAQTPQSWTGSLPPLTTSSVFVGSQQFVNNDELKIWTSMPNGSVDTTNVDDTISLVLHTSLNGLYSIDATSGDFATFTEAVQALVDFGVCGPVTFNVAAGTYNEQISIPEIAGGSDVNTITFQSASGVNTDATITYSSTGTGDNYTVRFEGTSNVTVKDLTIENLGSSYSRPVVLFDEANKITIDNNIINSPTTTSTSTNRVGIFADGDGFDNVTITNNEINNTANSIYFDASSGDYTKNLVIENNRLINPYYRALYVYYSEDAVINNNYAVTDDAVSYAYGFYIYNGTRAKITNNYIDEGADYFDDGMYIVNLSGDLNTWAEVSGNRVKHNGYGIYLSNAVFGIVSNNTVFTAVGSSNSSSRSLYVNNGNVNQVFNNNLVNNTNGFAYYVNGNPFHISDNNNFYSSGNNPFYSGGNIADLATFIATTNTDSNSVEVSTSITDTVNLKSCNDTLNGAGRVSGYSLVDFEGDVRDANTPDIGADEFATLSTFSLGDDVVLCSGDSLKLDVFFFDTVVFNSVDTTNSVMVYNPATYFVEVKGVCGVAHDTIAVIAPPASQLPSSENLCDGETKTLDPSISNGVYDWSTGENTATIDVSAAGTYSVTIVDEFGCNSVSSISVTQSQAVNLPDTIVSVCQGATAFLDAGISGSYAWNTGSSDQVLNVTAAGIYTVTVTDPHNCVSTDDATVQEVLLPIADFNDSTSYLTGIFTNVSQNGTSYSWDFGDGTTSDLKDPLTHVYSNFNSTVTYTVSLTVTNMCGSDTYTTDIVVGPTSVEDLNIVNNVAMYPNPSTGIVNINVTSEESAEVRFEIVDIQGKTLMTQSNTVNGQLNKVIDMSDVAKGIYFVKVIVGEEFSTHRIVIQ